MALEGGGMFTDVLYPLRRWEATRDAYISEALGGLLLALQRTSAFVASALPRHRECPAYVAR